MIKIKKIVTKQGKELIKGIDYITGFDIDVPFTVYFERIKL